MQAIVHTEYGSPDKLSLQDVPQPTPEPHQVLVKVHAASINKYDWVHLTGNPFLVRLMGAGILKPNQSILGADFAGEVVALGADVTDFQVGDAVYSSAGAGAYAEYVCVSARGVAPKPASLSFAEAAAVPMAGLTALQALRDTGKISAGQQVLIHGASGGVGSFAVQIAKQFGATVTGVCSGPKMAMVRALGADHVIDYQQEDVTASDHTYDLILDTAAHRSVAHYKRILAPDGRYVLVGGAMPRMFQTMWLAKRGQANMQTMLARIKRDDLLALNEWLDAGDVAPAIDRRFKLAEVPQALRYFDSGQVRGKVMITITDEAQAS